MTNQEAFDKAAVHLIRQGRKSETENHHGGAACRYRGPNGLMCAIGVLIPDWAYEPSIEGVSVDCLNGSALDALDGADREFLYVLQRLHDNDDARDWRARLGRFARRHSISTAILDAEPLGPAER
jgi:hypothetical protein